MTKRNGFTLMESLYSLLFLSIMIGSLIPQMSNLIKNYQSVVNATEQYHYLSNCLQDNVQSNRDTVGIYSFSFERTNHHVIVQLKGGNDESQIILHEAK